MIRLGMLAMFGLVWFGGVGTALGAVWLVRRCLGLPWEEGPVEPEGEVPA